MSRRRYAGSPRVPGLAVHRTAMITVVGWETNIGSGIDEVFASLSSGSNATNPFDIPMQEESYDVDRFLAKYFLEGLNGDPAPQKTRIQSGSSLSSGTKFRLESASRRFLASTPVTFTVHTIAIQQLPSARTVSRQESKKLMTKGEERAAHERSRNGESSDACLSQYQYMQTYQALPCATRFEQSVGVYLKCEKLDWRRATAIGEDTTHPPGFATQPPCCTAHLWFLTCSQGQCRSQRQRSSPRRF